MRVCQNLVNIIVFMVFWQTTTKIKYVSPCYTVSQPHSGDSLEADSCQRQWGTNRCPEAFDALHAVLSWVFRRWNNSKNPHDKYDMPTEVMLVVLLLVVVFFLIEVPQKPFPHISKLVIWGVVPKLLDLVLVSSFP